MAREYRDWSKIDPVEYFQENYEGKITGRKQLSREDEVLYQKLCELGKLDALLPKQHRDWSKVDPVAYFQEHYEGKITGRTELKRKDSGLHQKLFKLGALDEVLPDVQRRDWSTNDPDAHFNEHVKGKVASRAELRREDSGLHIKLLRLGVLGRILPPAHMPYRDWSKIDPVAYFDEHWKGKVSNRRELYRRDQGLYQKLRQQGKLDEILPDKRSVRDWSKTDPVAYFHRHWKGKVSGRRELQQKDRGLYALLWRRGKLDELFPRPGTRAQLEDLLKRYVEPDKKQLEHLLGRFSKEGDDAGIVMLCMIVPEVA
jgi:hypothetical protein